MNNSNPLWQDIIRFSKYKTKLAVSLIVLGIVGLILPILPGTLLLAIGVFLIKPEWYETVKKWFQK